MNTRRFIFFCWQLFFEALSLRLSEKPNNSIATQPPLNLKIQASFPQNGLFFKIYIKSVGPEPNRPFSNEGGLFSLGFLKGDPSLQVMPDLNCEQTL